MTVYALDISGSMVGDPVDDSVADMRRRVGQHDVVILFTDILHVHRDAAAFLRNPQIPSMGPAEMKIVYDWMAANAPGEDLVVYTDGGMSEVHDRQDDGRTCIMLIEPSMAHPERIFPGMQMVSQSDW